MRRGRSIPSCAPSARKKAFGVVDASEGIVVSVFSRWSHHCHSRPYPSLTKEASPVMSKKYVKSTDATFEHARSSGNGLHSHNNEDVAADGFHRQYDLTPLSEKGSRNRRSSNSMGQRNASSSYPVDPFETVTHPKTKNGSEIFFASTSSDSSVSVEDFTDECVSDEVLGYDNGEGMASGKGELKGSRRSTFIKPSEIHPRMEEREDDIAQLRLLAGKLNADWGAQDLMAPALARRIRDFQFAQEKRREKYGEEKPWGILGLYDHLASIRVDVEWAEDAAWRRANGEP